VAVVAARLQGPLLLLPLQVAEVVAQEECLTPWWAPLLHLHQLPLLL
jgi:hypothetical protein